jgi:hypothetical protein
LALLSPLGFIAVVGPLFSVALPHHDAKPPEQSEPGPGGSHKTALKKFLSVSELALDREMAATYILGPFRLDAETNRLFRHGHAMHIRQDQITSRG